MCGLITAIVEFATINEFMKTLELVKRWTGDGFAQNPVLLTQVKRNAKVALYKRTFEKTGKFNGYEVFLIRVDPKGKRVFDTVLEDDEEKYPTAQQFGRTAYHFYNEKYALFQFDELTKKADKNAAGEEEEKKPVVVPTDEFTVGEFAEKNSLQYASAFLIVKDAVKNGSVKFIREERRNAKGKASKIYAACS